MLSPPFSGIKTTPPTKIWNFEYGIYSHSFKPNKSIAIARFWFNPILKELCPFLKIKISKNHEISGFLMFIVSYPNLQIIILGSKYMFSHPRNRLQLSVFKFKNYQVLLKLLRLKILLIYIIKIKLAFTSSAMCIFQNRMIAIDSLQVITYLSNPKLKFLNLDNPQWTSKNRIFRQFSKFSFLKLTITPLILG